MTVPAPERERGRRGRWWQRLRRAAPVPSEVTPRWAPETYQAFLDQGRWHVSFQIARGEAVERKGGVLLGFVGVILVLLVDLRTPVAEVEAAWLAAVAIALLGLSVVGFLTAAFLAVKTMSLKRYAAPHPGQIREEWLRFQDAGTMQPHEAIGSFARQLIEGASGHAPVQELSEMADARSRSFKWALRSLFASLVVVGVVVVAILTEGAM